MKLSHHARLSDSIIGGADGPTSIFLAGKLGQTGLLGPIAAAAYSYMALVPLIQPPIMKLLTISLPKRTPAAVPNINATNPNPTILSVSQFKNASALVVAPTDVPSKITTIYIIALTSCSCMRWDQTLQVLSVQQ